MTNLYEASHQWSTRPDDERFSNIQEMYEATKQYAQSAVTKNADLPDLRTVADNGNLFLTGASGAQAKLTHYSFGQISRLAGAPPEYLRGLPATLAAQNINHGLKRLGDFRPEDKLSLLLHRNGSLVARAVTTDSYDRVWNHEVIAAIMNAAGAGWRVPPARPAREGQAGTRLATEADILPNQGDFGLAVKVGDPIAPAGLYASDHDMFMFLVNQENPVYDGQKFLNRGVFIQNSEVGDCSLRFKVFTYDNVCGNHIVWGVGQVTESVIRHIKSEKATRGKTLSKAKVEWAKIAGPQAALDIGAMEATIRNAQRLTLGHDKDEALAEAFGLARKNGLNLLTRGTLEAAYDIAVQTPRYGDPKSVWGLVNGLTEFSQKGFTDERTALDVQAGQLLNIVPQL